MHQLLVGLGVLTSIAAGFGFWEGIIGVWFWWLISDGGIPQGRVNSNAVACAFILAILSIVFFGLAFPK
ncbi:MAG: hypothetical protein ACREGR_04335 [Minisyncoccia bacterium]